ncbi:DUF4112 domain-containing protein [Aestuariimicrobium sp. p3-SID1156]|uniref:DUF4112 domain-containing protein n=1 Tax=Aestuariimicrobium sp. p3-SID1156 TaxID=2916038 RepID=UPI00223B0DAA|nr:DUF4112 domain-containing protein [Aestuariimicrobium sp. p3-SID1156]MCT1459139.1 DUF4112 domain-containing protein [Aestuariimicrobium sp. p3-SID1156]
MSEHPRPGGRRVRRKEEPAAPVQPAKESDLLATVLDDLVRIPGTNFGIGLDGLICLIPGVGDSLTTVLASTMLTDAVRRRVPIPVLLRMAWNLLFDTALGWVPFIGDAADIAHRANRKNYRLLRQAIETGEFSTDPHRVYLAKAVAVVLGVVLVMAASAIAAIWIIISVLAKLVG